MKVVSKRSRKYGTRSEKRQERIAKRHTIEGIRILLEEMKFKLAHTCIEEYIKENGYDCYIIHEYGKFYQRQSNLKEARKYFNMNIENNSENMCYSLYELAKLEKYEGNYEKAIEYLNAIINSKHYDKSHAMLELAKIYTISENYDEAEVRLNELINSEFDEATKDAAFYSLIQSKINCGKTKEASILLEQIESKHEDPKIKMLIGQLEEKKGNTVKAYEIYYDILKNSKECKISVSYELAKIEMELENYDIALTLLDSILESNNLSYNVEALEVKINCLIKMGSYEQAKVSIKDLLNINSKSENIANYYLGKIEFYQHDYEKALSFYEKVSKNNKRTYRDMLYKKICCLIKIKNYKEAYNTFEELKEFDLNSKYGNKYNMIEIYLKNMLNEKHNIEPKNYIENLLNDYNYQGVIKHINKHKEMDETKINHTIFNENIDLEELYKYVILNINDDNFTSNNFNDVYTIEYKNIGYSKTKELHYIRVVTIPNSKKIVTMYPYDNKMLYKNKKIEKNKIKTKSRIDKFNQKYGIT